MKISDYSSVNKLLKKQDHQVKQTVSSEHKNKTCEHLDISSRAKEVERLVSQAFDAPLESSRIKAIKEKIAAGEYELDSKKLAEKMLKKD